MQEYEIFGGRLHTDLVFPGVPRCHSPGTPDWLVSRGDMPATPFPSPPLAELADDGFIVQLHECVDGWRLTYSDTGTYDVSADGASILWCPGPAPVPELVQADILGRVLAVSLSAAGVFALHGSAVALGDNSVVILGAKHHGKSTFAAALTSAGARLVADDMAAIEIGPNVLLRPGVPQLRLWRDSADQLLAGATLTRTTGIKQTLSGFPLDRLEQRSTSLRAIYVLDPVAGDTGATPIARTRLEPMAATIALLRHAKVGGLLCGSLASTSMRCAAEVVRRIPVFSLRVIRDLDRLPALADAFLAWHREDIRAAPEQQ